MTSNASKDLSPSTSSASTNHHVRRQSSALHGASHAFFSGPPPLRPLPNTYSGTNGALAAASAAGLGRKRQEESSARGSSTYGSKSETVPFKSSRQSGPSNMRDATRQSSHSREQSPSYTAAMLATSRSGTPKSTPSREPKSSPRPVSRRPSPLQGVRRGPDTVASSPAVDDTPSKATTSLVQLFESKQPPKSSAPVTQSVRYYTKPTPAIASPTPVRPLKTFNLPPTASLSTFATTSTTDRNVAASKVSKPSHAGAAGAASRLAGPARVGTTKSVQPVDAVRRVPEHPAPQRSRKMPPVDGSANDITFDPMSQPERRPSVFLHKMARRPVMARSQTSGGRIPAKSNLRNTSTAIPQGASEDATEVFLNDAAAILQKTPPKSSGPPSIPTWRSYSMATPLPQSSNPSSRPALQPTRSFDKRVPTSDALRPVRITTRSSDSYVSQLTVDSLADAMVASSLASSRAPSPSKPPPLPPPRRHGKSYSLFHHQHSQEQILRTPSPAKTMRHTMRDPAKSDDEVDYKKKRGHIVRKHPNKHHEGDRKRYRNQVTEREKKRYEGVWAANKGILMHANSSDAVLNVVVRDIWRRSHLPDDVLEEVWDLVDTQGIGKLEREEFVVGMFLIDSRLKGNKLPFKVSDSLWYSVRRLTGLKVPQKRH